MDESIAERVLLSATGGIGVHMWLMTRNTCSQRAGLAALPLMVVAISSCARPSTSRPESVVSATGRSACESAGAGRVSALVVDQQPERRADLEVAMTRGLAVVRYDCRTLQVLPQCSVPGAYGYVGTEAKEQLVRLTDRASAAAQLPLLGPRLFAKAEARHGSSSSLDLAMMIVGKRQADHEVLSIDELRGDCRGATHVVESATLGAFAFGTSNRQATRAAAGIFGAEVAASSSASEDRLNRDGSIAACRTARPGQPAPPNHCGAVLRLELSKLEPPQPPIAILSSEQAAPLKGKFCPEVATCRDACQRGDAKACREWGTLLAIGDRVERDLGKSTTAFQRACRLDDMTACTLLGVAWMTRGPRRADAQRGRRLLERPCERGQPQACHALGMSFDNAGEASRAQHYFKRACDLGAEQACRRLPGS